MTVERSRRYFNRPASFAYFEILLEALVILVFATELSLDCATHLFPEWHEYPFIPRLKTGLVRMLLGTWQETDSLSSTGLLPRYDSVDRRSMSKMLSLGSIFLIGIAGAFYSVFVVFLFVNRKWSPPVFRAPYGQLLFIQGPIGMIYFLVYISIPQIVATVFVVMSQTGWFAIPADWNTAFRLALLYCNVMIYCLHYCLLGDFKSSLNADDTSTSEESTKTQSTERATLQLSKQANAQRICSDFARNVFCCTKYITQSVLWCVRFLTVVGVIAVTPAVSPMICAGVIRCLVAFCGMTAAFYGCGFLVCLMIMYSTGRMLGIWMSGSNVAWIVDKIRSFHGCKGGLQEIFPVEAVQAGNNRSHKRTNTDKRRFHVLLDCVIISVLSCAAWSSCIGGILDAYRYGSIDAVRKIREWTLAECASSMISQLLTGANNSTTCVFLNATISPMETTMLSISYLTSETLVSCASYGFYVVMAVLVYVPARWMVIIIIGKKCLGRKKHVPEPASTEDRCTKMVNRALGLLYLVPLSLVKIVLTVYGLDFFLPGRFYAIGLTAGLIGSAGLFCWKFIHVGVDWVKTLINSGAFSRRGRKVKGSLIGMDDAMPGKLDVLPEHAAEVGCQTEVPA